MKKLQMPKRDIPKMSNKMKSALLKPDRKASKKVSKTITKYLSEHQKQLNKYLNNNEEEVMKKTNIINLVVAVLTGLAVVGTWYKGQISQEVNTAKTLQKMELGFSSNKEDLKQLILITKDVVKDQVTAKVAIGEIKTDIKANKDQIKTLNERVYKMRRK